METEGEEDAAEGKPSVLIGLLGEGEEDGATVLLGLSRYGFKGRGECAAVWGRQQRKRWLSREKTMASRRGCVVS